MNIINEKSIKLVDNEEFITWASNYPGWSEDDVDPIKWKPDKNMPIVDVMQDSWAAKDWYSEKGATPIDSITRL